MKPPRSGSDCDEAFRGFLERVHALEQEEDADGVDAVSADPEPTRARDVRRAAPATVALWIGVLLCGAAVTSVRLWHGRYSTWTLDYPLAIDLLQRPFATETEQTGALMVAITGVMSGVDALKAAAQDASSSTVRSAAREALAELRGQLEGGALPPVEADASVAEMVAEFRAAKTDDEARRLVGRVAALAKIGLIAVQRCDGCERFLQQRPVVLRRVGRSLLQ